MASRQTIIQRTGSPEAIGFGRHDGKMRRLRLGFWLGLCVLLFAGMAWASTVLRHRASHLTRKSPDEVLRVLTAYEQHCDRGCKYWGPRIVQWVTVPYYRSRDDYYTWTYMSARRDA